MKYLFGLIACIALVSFHPLSDIYSIAVKNIDGNQIDLSLFKGKKMLFIVLPLSAEDSAVKIEQIIQLQTKYQRSLVVIGIPSEEAGFTTADSSRFKQLYKDASANFIITEGMKVKKGSGQSALLQWLTCKEMNRHYDQDVQGVGSKFFVDEAGELYGVMGPQLKLTNALIDKILTRPEVKKQ